LLLALPAQRAGAQDDVVLIRLLQEGHSFRVRARAAMALGSARAPDAHWALEAALRDQHAAVRAAAASSLGRIGTKRSVPALRSAAADASPEVATQAKAALSAIAARETIERGVSLVVAAVPAPVEAPSLDRVRYAVVLGDMRDHVELSGPEVTKLLWETVATELRKLDYVIVLSLSDMTEALAHELAARKVPAFRLEGSISRIERNDSASELRTRCEVSLLLMDEVERTLRSMMRGAATASEQPRGPRPVQQHEIARKTLKSAVRSAMANAMQAIEAASIRRDLGMGDIRAEASLGSKRRQR
jgi:hypothetical protein